MSYHTDEDELIKAVKDGMEEVKKKLTTEAEEILEHKFTAFMRDNLPSGFTNLRPYGGSAKGIAGQIIGDAKLQAFRDGECKSAMISVKTGIDALMTKSTIVGDDSASTGTYPTSTARAPGIANDPRERLSLLQIMPRIPVGTGVFEYVELNSLHSDAAAVQDVQGSLKAEEAFDFELRSATIATIATTVPIAEQVLADNPALGQFLQSRMSYGVLKKLERELISGTGATGYIAGLTVRGTSFTPSTTSATPADAIGEAIAALEALGWTASAVILNPATWQAMRAERSTDDDHYIAGSWAMPAAPSVWSVPVVLSNAVASDTAIVLDASQIALLDRQAVTFEFGRVDDGFVRNIISGRAELRAGLMVASPSAVQIVTL